MTVPPIKNNSTELQSAKPANWSCPDRAEFSGSTNVCPDNTPTRPYSLPDRLDEELSQVLAYWTGLKRGNADIPFADDLKLSELWKFSNQIILLHILQMPVRFRFEIAGHQLIRTYGEDLLGRFVDDLPVRPPLNYFHSQSSATVDAHAPTFYRHPSTDDHRGYGRILLPLWADGRTAALLGAMSH